MSVIRTLTPSRLRRSSPLPRAGEGGARRVSDGRVRARPFRKYAKRAGIVVVALLALDFVVGTAAVAFGAAEWLKR